MPSLFPTATLSYTILANQRITPFVSLLATQGAYITGVTNQLIARGYTCVGSSNGVAAALDGVNRCTTAAGFAVRAANTTTAQSWIVLKDARNVQILFSYTGASDDIMRVAISTQAGYVIAGTATFCPTATDEQVIISALTTIGATASADRVFDVWTDSGNTTFMMVCFRQGVIAGALVRVADYDASMLVGGAGGATVLGPQTMGWFGTPNGITTLYAAYSAGTAGGVARFTDSSGNVSAQLGGAGLGNSGGVNFDASTTYTFQGGAPFIRDVYLHAGTAKGFVGRHKDLWTSVDVQSCGATSPSLLHLYLSNTAAPSTVGTHLLVPWDGVTTPQVS